MRRTWRSRRPRKRKGNVYYLQAAQDGNRRRHTCSCHPRQRECPMGCVLDGCSASTTWDCASHAEANGIIWVRRGWRGCMACHHCCGWGLKENWSLHIFILISVYLSSINSLNSFCKREPLRLSRSGPSGTTLARPVSCASECAG